MKLPRRRGSRTHGRARLALTGDHDDGRDIADAIADAAPAPWDGTTVPLSGLRGQPRFTPAPTPGVIPPGVKAVKQYGRNTHPFAFGARPAVPPPPARPALAIAAAPSTPAEDALAHLCLAVKRLAQPDRTGQNKLSRVSDKTLEAMAARRRDGLRQPRTTAYLIVAEAVEHLCAGREPWTPDYRPPAVMRGPHHTEGKGEPWNYPDGAA